MSQIAYILNTDQTFINNAGKALESDERLSCADLICEGPIEGLVDRDGELLKFITDETNTQVDSLILGKGVYYNNVPLIDSKLNKLNFVTAGFNISYGGEFNDYKNQYASTVHKYNQKLYLNESNIFDNAFNLAGAGIFAFFQSDKNEFFDDSDSIIDNPLKGWIRSNSSYNINGVFIGSNLAQTLDEAKRNCQEFNHKIVNKYADQISIQLRANQLFQTDNSGNTISTSGIIAIEFSQDNSAFRYFVLVKMIGISKSGFTVDVPIALRMNSVVYNNYYIKVYCLSSKISPTNGTTFKDFSVSAIVERIKDKGNFSYPFTALVKSAVSSRHFNEDPERTFDLKLLKIKVPNNYDPEIREYSGNWNGKFESFLRWTDNPAWIFYDICTNSRYGVGNGLILERDLNKWDLYKIGKYCDELIKIATPSKYDPDTFYIDTQNKNIIYVPKGDRTIESFKSQYPPIFDLNKQFAYSNGGYQNSVIYLYDLENDAEKFENAHKKLIWSIEEDVGNFKIKLINDFGVRKFFENDNTNLMQLFCDQYIPTVDTKKSLKDRINEGLKNTQAGAKSFVLECMSNSVSNYTSYIETQIFSDDYYYDKSDENPILLRGKCMPRVFGYRDPFENRFSCNVVIDNDTEALKILNDLASIFRGITYYKNNVVTSTIDVAKPVSYIFNNSNIKNGAFSYSSASLDGNHTVAKVLYKDRYENFTEQVEIVEDYDLIKNYGIIIKEILGFGITSKDQARRIGQWLLLTNRFENQTVTFSTDLQGISLRPSDVIQIEDQYKNNNILQGRVVDVDYDNKFITIDRQLNLNLTGQKIKFIYDKKTKSIADLNNLESVSDSDLDSLNINNVIELKIARIENNTNRIYFDSSYNYSFFNSILRTTPFVIEDNDSNQVSNLYKIVTISEIDNNEYQIFCIRYEQEKYEALTKNSFQSAVNFSDNSISYAISDILSEIKIDGINFYSTSNYSLNQLSGLNIDFYFNEPRTSLIKSSQLSKDYSVLNLDCINLFNQISIRSTSDSYYKNILTTLNDGGGILFKIGLRNQNIKFYVKSSSVANKSVFLGKYGNSSVSFYASAEVKLYLFDKNNKIIDV
jgi:hypothetical protein